MLELLQDCITEVQEVKLLDSVYGVQMVALCVIGALGCTALIVGGEMAILVAVPIAGAMGTIVGILFKNKVTEV